MILSLKDIYNLNGSPLVDLLDTQATITACMEVNFFFRFLEKIGDFHFHGSENPLFFFDFWKNIGDFHCLKFKYFLTKAYLMSYSNPTRAQF